MSHADLVPRLLVVKSSHEASDGFIDMQAPCQILGAFDPLRKCPSYQHFTVTNEQVGEGFWRSVPGSGRLNFDRESNARHASIRKPICFIRNMGLNSLAPNLHQMMEWLN